ncbi:hypothetical protein SDC9_111054 [bioreactor metagenome]|uniref:Uncharacterized protein n=1 Tax=bioreactor metagenome TaxID=1076179 RepID=A0A645BGG9_9ZZZZ
MISSILSVYRQPSSAARPCGCSIPFSVFSIPAWYLCCLESLEIKIKYPSYPESLSHSWKHAPILFQRLHERHPQQFQHRKYVRCPKSAPVFRRPAENTRTPDSSRYKACCPGSHLTLCVSFQPSRYPFSCRWSSVPLQVQKDSWGAVPNGQPV